MFNVMHVPKGFTTTLSYSRWKPLRMIELQVLVNFVEVFIQAIGHTNNFN